jgi:ABC-type antimicrobial peptide transport system permease subunit
MGKFVVGRVLSLASVVVMVTVVTWLCIHLLRPEPFAFDDRGLLTQLGDYVYRAFVHFDLGRSWETDQPAVSDLMREGLPADLWLLFGGLVFGIGAGVAAGTYVGARPRTKLSRAIETVSMASRCPASASCRSSTSRSPRVRSAGSVR